MEDIKRAGFSISKEVAEAASEAHFTQGKEAACEILRAAGVPMKKRTSEGDGIRTKTVFYDCGKHNIFAGF